MRFFTSKGCSRTSKPATVAVPAVGGMKHVNMRIVVVLPAPLGPKKPTIWPFWISKEMWSTAVLRAYLFVSSLTVIMDFYFCREMHNVSNRPKQIQSFNSEALCYELRRAAVNPSFEKQNSLPPDLKELHPLLKLFAELRELALQIRDFILQTRNFALELCDAIACR